MIALDVLFVLYLLAALVGLYFTILLIWAPMKLYAIHRELQILNDETHIQTRLLASLANAEAELEETHDWDPVPNT